VKKQVEVAGREVQQQFVCEFQLDVLLLRWEHLWWNAPRIWWDFGSALPFQTRLTQTKPVLQLSNEHGSQVKDQGRRQYWHNKHKKFPYRPTCDASLISGHASYFYVLDWGESKTNITDSRGDAALISPHPVSLD